MGDASMLRTLDFRARAIWPQESALRSLRSDRRAAHPRPRLRRRRITSAPGARCIRRPDSPAWTSCRKISPWRARERRPGAPRSPLRRRRCVRHMDFPEAHFDLVVCRHLSQCVPQFGRVLAEINRVLAPGGWLHLSARTTPCCTVPRGGHVPTCGSTGPCATWRLVVCDGAIGRHSPALLQQAGYEELRVDYVVVDAARVRAVFAGILAATGATATSPAGGGRPPAGSAPISTPSSAIETPPNYAVWQVPIVSARRPA